MCIRDRLNTVVASRARPTPQYYERPGRSGDVIGRGLGRGCVSPPTRPRANCARWLWTMKQEDNENWVLTEEKLGFVLAECLIEPYSVDQPTSGP